MKSIARLILLASLLVVSLPLPGQTNITHVRNCVYSMGTIRSVDVMGDHAYCAGTGSSLYILDIADPTHPQYAGIYNSTGSVASKDVQITGNTAIVFQDGRVQWLDISIPAQPQLMGSATFTDNFLGQAVSGNFTYVTTTGGYLYCWDATNPSAPVLADTLHVSTGYNSLRVAVLGNLAYLSGGGNWRILDISDPYSITQIGTVPDTQNRYIKAFGNGQIYGVESVTLYIYEQSDTGGLNLASSSISVYGDQIYSICCGDGYIVLNYVLVMGSYNISYWYMFVNVSDPSNPTMIRNVQYDGSSIDLCANKFFIIPGTSITIFNVGQGGSPLVLQGVYAQGSVVDIAQNSDHIFIKDSGGYVKSLGNLNAPEPDVLSMVNVEGVTNLAVSENLLIASTATYDPYGYPEGSATLHVYSVSPSGNLLFRYLHSFYGNATSSVCMGSQIVGQTGYFAISYELFSADLSNTSGMVQLSNLAGYGINCIKVAGNRAYCGGYSDGGYKLLILDLSDPQSITVMSSLPMPNEVLAIGQRYNRAYVAGNWPSLLTVDVSDPFTPSLVATTQLALPVLAIDSGQNHITVLSGNMLYVYDTGNGASLAMRGSFPLPGNNYAMVVRDNLVYIAQGSYIGVYDISAAIALCTLAPEESVPPVPTVSVSPNPFHHGTSIVFKVPCAARATAWVYNTRGQKVCELPEADLQKGVNTLQWDGRDACGKVLPNGIYILSGCVGQQRFTRKLTIIK